MYRGREGRYGRCGDRGILIHKGRGKHATTIKEKEKTVLYKTLGSDMFT